MSRIEMLCATLMVALAATSAVGEQLEFNPKTMMSLAEIEPGMQAVGKSVFSGVEITEFNLEILGVLPKLDLGKDIILARIIDGPIVERHTGVLGGMSGSPVYIDGKLIGAISLGWLFEKEAITGISSIEAMLEAFEGESTSQANARTEGVMVGGRYVTQVAVVSPWQAANQPFIDEQTLAMSPVTPLVYCSGFAAEGMAQLSKFFGNFGIEPLQGPGAMSNPVDTELVPGAALGVQLAAGDFDITSVGTLTYREGDTILAFGHPLLELGDVAFPMTTAWVHEFVPSYQRGNKLASAMKPVGTVTRDCGWSVAGVVGELPTLIPIAIEITDLDRNLTKSYNVQVAQQRLLAPQVVMSVVLSAVTAGYDSSREGTVRLSYTVEGAKGATIQRSDTWPHPGMPDFTVITSLMEAFSILTDNRFEPQEIKSVSVKAALESVDRIATIEKVYTDQTVAKAGEKLTVHVVLRPQGGQRFEEVVELPVPIETPSGAAYVVVGGGLYAWTLRARMGMLLPEFEALQDIIDEYQSLEENTELLVGLGLPTLSIGVGRSRLMNVPSALTTVLVASPRTDLSAARSGHLETVDTEYAVDGYETLIIPTVDRKGTKGAGPQRRPGGPSAPGMGAPSVPGVPGGPGGMAASYQFAPEETSVEPGNGIPASLWWAASGFHSPDRVSLHRPPPAQRLQPGGRPGGGMPEIPPELKALMDAGPSMGPPEKDKKPKEQEEEKAEDKGVIIRRPSLWVQTDADDFAKGKIDGSAIRSDGVLCLSPKWQQKAVLPDFYTFCLYAAPDGTMYAGTGSRARVYRLDDDGPKLLLDTREFAVHSIAAAPDGSLITGTSPNGKIYRIAPDGETSLLCDLDEDYVWCLMPDSDGGFLAGSGPHGKLFRIDTEGQATELAVLPESHIMSFARLDGTVYLGTASGGAVYRVGEDGRVVPIFEAGDDDVAQLAVRHGSLYLATSGKGCIYKLAADGKFKQVYEDDNSGFLCLTAANGRLYAGAGEEGKIICLVDDETASVVYSSETEAQVMALGTGAGGEVYAALPNPGRLLVANDSAAGQGTFVSEVLDAERQARWGRVRWWAQAPEGCTVTVTTRSGNSDDPDDGSWSAWSSAYDRPGQNVASPPARYLQYRVNFSKPEGEAVPSLSRVAIAYLPGNQPPALEVKKPEEATAIRAEYELEWDTEDDDDDTLETTVYIAGVETEAWERIAGPLSEEKYELDTTEHADGAYGFKFVLSDRPSNPSDPLSDEKILGGVVIDNTAPALKLQGPLLPEDDGGYALPGSAYDGETPLTTVVWQVEGSDDWWAAAPDDGLYDKQFERFTIHTGPLPEDAERLIVRARDSAGNVTDETIDLPDAEPAAEVSEETPKA